MFILEKSGERFYDNIRDRNFTHEELFREYNSELKRFDSISKPVMIEERMLDQNPEYKIPRDCKFYCFNGRVAAIMLKNVNGGRNPKDWSYRYFNRDWEDIGEVYQGVSYDHSLPIPEHAEQMVEVVEKLSAWIPIPFVRIDMYSTTEGPVFGEFTFHPGTYRRYDAEFNHLLGEYYAQAEQAIQESGINLHNWYESIKEN